jgi:hypothetical protein
MRTSERNQRKRRKSPCHALTTIRHAPRICRLCRVVDYGRGDSRSSPIPFALVRVESDSRNKFVCHSDCHVMSHLFSHVRITQEAAADAARAILTQTNTTPRAWTPHRSVAPPSAASPAAAAAVSIRLRPTVIDTPTMDEWQALQTRLHGIPIDRLPESMRLATVRLEEMIRSRQTESSCMTSLTSESTNNSRQEHRIITSKIDQHIMVRRGRQIQQDAQLMYS